MGRAHESVERPSSELAGFAESGHEVAELLPAPMTIREAANYLGIGENVLRSMCRRGQVRAFKAGGQWRILPSDVTDYILKQLQKS